MAYNYKIIDFLATKNTVKVTNEEEFDDFYRILKEMGFASMFRYDNFDEWQVLAQINHRNPHLFCFEYDNARGLTWYDNEKASIAWYGIQPLTVLELKDYE